MVRGKVYFDTNIVADMIEPTRPDHDRSIQLLKKLGLEDNEMYISEDMLSTIYYISQDRVSTLEFFENIVYIDWTVLTFGKSVIKNATDLSLQNSLDLEDLLQCLCAKENGCDLFITSDKKFHDCGVKIVGYEYFDL